jgi:superfamily I DNA and RNA helicase
MAIDILITSDRISSDPIGREFIEHVQREARRLRLDDAAVYYDFPIFSDYETVAHRPDALVVSPYHGVIAIRFVNGADTAQLAALAPIDESLGQFCSILIGRLLKSRILRKSLSLLLFPVSPVILALSAKQNLNKIETSSIVTSFESFDTLLAGIHADRLDDDAIAEARSVIEGAKALTRPQKRVIEDSAAQQRAVALSKLEAEIANFDQKQRRAAIVNVQGPQRIRGLAGSGKTVILAMKAAHLHIDNPNSLILVTFFTRSLRGSLRNLITKFYRHYKDEDPDWNRIQVRHGWGGSRTSGTYADAARRYGRAPLSLVTAQQAAGTNVDPFDFACRDLLRNAQVEPYYDHILIDEGQDFPIGFYELCFALAKGDRDNKNIVWAYDELQNILNVKIRSPAELFGEDSDGQPRISLERSARNLPPGASNDTVLSKCYRNQREVLVTAHALGFGIYSQIVQLLESREHWQDVGYQVVSEGEFEVGKTVRILRPPENSPLTLDEVEAGKLIEWHTAASAADEIAWVIEGVRGFLASGLQPEDILVIALDDRYARRYLRALSERLSAIGISSNNIIADPYTEPPFTILGKVTLSTVYRAKGNEAAVVFALGVDAIPLRTRSGRNRLFTAFTRTKAWLRISGVASLADNLFNELDAALAHFPYLEFQMPDLREIELIQRDLSERQIRAIKIRDEFLEKLRSAGFSDDEITDILAAEVNNGPSRDSK